MKHKIQWSDPRDREIRILEKRKLLEEARRRKDKSDAGTLTNLMALASLLQKAGWKKVDKLWQRPNKPNCELYNIWDAVEIQMLQDLNEETQQHLDQTVPRKV